ncbi:MAG: tripartite tricarboxylate transporter substrate binding protein [Pseudomonadota bacterium]
MHAFRYLGLLRERFSFLLACLLGAGHLLVATGVAALLSVAGTAAAQPYPDHPIKWIVPFAPGGGGDTTARLVAREAEKLLGQPFVIDNRPGAATILGVQALMSAPSDGYTVFSGNDSLATNLYLLDKVPYTLDDVVGISVISKSPLALVARTDFPAKDLAELMQQIKASGGRLNYGSWGIGSTSHLAMETLLDRTGANATHVPYSGSAPAALALISGQLDVMFIDVGTGLPYIKSGKMKLFAISTKERNPAFPDTPTLGEAALPGFDMYSWNGLWVRKGTPAPTVQKLTGAVQKVLSMPEFRKDQIERGNVPWGSTPQELDKLLHDNAVAAKDLIQRRKIRLQQ